MKIELSILSRVKKINQNKTKPAGIMVYMLYDGEYNGHNGRQTEMHQLDLKRTRGARTHQPRQPLRAHELPSDWCSEPQHSSFRPITDDIILNYFRARA